jgi:hypothetical protein
MFVLGSDITIGKFKRVKPHSVKIEKSMFSYVDKAMITLPITSRIKQAGVVVSETVETAKQFGEGDKVTVLLGYNGKLRNEFEGFISRVNFTTPLEVQCEGYSYQLKIKTYLKTFKQVQLLDVLKYLVAGTDIRLDEKLIPGFKIEKMVLQNHSGTEALEMIKKISGNTIRLFFTGNLLYAGLQYLKPKADVKYRLGWNVIKDGNLKQRQAKNQDVEVHYIGEKKDGTKVRVKVGNHTSTKDQVIKTNAIAGATGETKIIKTHAVVDESSLKQMADAKLKQLKYDGYEGKITAFGIPYCEAGYRGVIEDQKYPERSGNYIVESTEVNYTTGGFRRIVGIGYKL